MKESLALMVLLHAKHIGPRTGRILIAHYQTAEAVWAGLKAQLCTHPLQDRVCGAFGTIGTSL